MFNHLTHLKHRQNNINNKSVIATERFSPDKILKIVAGITNIIGTIFAYKKYKEWTNIKGPRIVNVVPFQELKNYLTNIHLINEFAHKMDQLGPFTKNNKAYVNKLVSLSSPLKTLGIIVEYREEKYGDDKIYASTFTNDKPLPIPKSVNIESVGYNEHSLKELIELSEPIKSYIDNVFDVMNKHGHTDDEWENWEMGYGILDVCVTRAIKILELTEKTIKNISKFYKK